MIKNWKKLLPLLALSLAAESSRAAAPATAQGLITGKGFYGITGTAVANLTNNAKFPNKPDALFFLPYFEWNATGDITVAPGNFADNYGSQIVGYFYPPKTGDYVFWISSDDNGALYLSTDSNSANKKLIARETAWSNPRGYTVSGGNSDLTAKDSSQFAASEWPVKDPATGLAKITLQAGQAYYIEAIAKEGGGGDNLSVAVADPAATIDSSSPIPGQYLSSDRTTGAAAIATQPLSQTIPERGSVTFSVDPQGTPPFAFQWLKGGVDIPDATNVNYTISSVTVGDNNTKYSVLVRGPQTSVTSQEAVLTVAPDVVRPTVLEAKGTADRTGVVLTFSEPLDPTSSSATANYKLSSATGSLNVTGAALSQSGNQVTLTTAPQTLGSKYTLLLNNIKDTAAVPNTISTNAKVVFFPAGRIIEQNGLIVFEAENYDRNLDGLWTKDTTRGIPSNGASMVNANGAGGSENATQLEYDVDFKSAATYYVWYRASGNDGNDDSSWFHIDGARPAERASGNQASMTGFSGALDFVWRSDAQDAPDPFTVDIPSPGVHVVGIARREDGAFFDKMILTTNSTYSPTGFGPPETREGAPGVPTVSITGPTAGQTFATGSSIPLTVTAAGKAGLDIAKVQYSVNGNVIGESTTAPFSFTITNAAAGVYGIRATAFDEIGQSTQSDSVAVTVGTPPPQALFVVGTASDPALNPSDAGVKARLETNGWQVTVVQAPVSKTSDGDGKQLIVVSSTVNSGDVGTKFQKSAVPVLLWEQAVQDDFLMTLNTDTVDRGTITAQTQLEIVNSGHPLAAGLTNGLRTVAAAAQDFSWGSPNSNAVKIATIAGNPSQAVIYGYDKGAILIDGTTPAPARRVMFFSANDGFAGFTDDAKKLLDAAVQWASGIAPKPPKTSARIAWVSFHSADGTPSTGAAGAGFTKAPDIAYTDLLKSAGHTVTRFLTTGTPDTNVLNQFDLVIIGRSVPSGDYQDPPETLAWNGIKAPTIILGGYVLRQNRLGLVTGNTIPDTAGPVQLTVTDPKHPIFAGIALDANKMTDVFANIVTNNGAVQRGVSVNTDAVAGNATVLATVGTAGDPAFGGTIISEYQAGATLANATANTLGGKRLVFLTGSREVNGVSSETAGIYDLTPTGAKLFQNAVNYMAGVQPSTNTTPAISIARTANGATITFAGTLQSASSITGPWADEAGATSPFSVTTSGNRKFYRARQ